MLEPAPLEEAVHELLLVDLDRHAALETQTELREQGIEGLRLLQGSREAVKDEATSRIRLGEPLFHHADHHRVRHELAALHDRLDLSSKLGARGLRRAQHFAGRDLRDAKAGDKALGLRPLARPRRPEKKQPPRRVHRPSLPRSRVPFTKPSYWRETRCDSICPIVSRATPTTMRRAVPPK